MISVGLVFIFIAGVSFLGFIINALFDKIKITTILPLMLIGLLVGPVFGLLGTSAQSTIAQLAPYVAAIAIAFIVFDVGINIRIKHLTGVLGSATKFALITQVCIGIILSIVAYYAFGWSVFASLIFGFAVSGPSSIITPTIVRKMGISENLKTTLTYESVLSDVLQLVVPLTLISFLLSNGSLTANIVGVEVFTIIVGALLFGVVFALFWLYIMSRFADYVRGYSWMLTITMIIATYGISQQLGLNSTIAVFIFGLVFANVGFHKEEKPEEVKKSSKAQPKDAMSDFIGKYLSIPYDVEHTIAYQKEVVFFVSTFFFVYIGLIFSLNSVSYYEIGIALLLSILIFLVRIATTPMLGGMMSKDDEVRKTERELVWFNVPRGLASIIIATLFVSYGIIASGFTNVVFLLVLFTNIIFSAGVMKAYKPIEEPKKDAATKKKDDSPKK